MLQHTPPEKCYQHNKSRMEFVFFCLISAELADGPERRVIKNTVDAVNGFSGAVNQRRRVAAGPGHTRAFGSECAVHCRQEQHPVCVCVCGVCVVAPQVSSSELISVSTLGVRLFVVLVLRTEKCS